MPIMDGRIVQWLESKYRGLQDELSEFTRRRWAAVEALSLGRGGITAVSAATGLAHSTIRRGIRELNRGVLSSLFRTFFRGDPASSPQAVEVRR